MADILRTMAARSAARADALDRRELAARVADAPPPTPLAIREFGLIAEFKRRSPSAGDLGTDLDRAVAAYTAGGAAAISVLTEPSGFGGSLADLEHAVAHTPLPVMRKDFLVDERQLAEARASGASGALLMASILRDEALGPLMATARELGLFVLAEAHGPRELERIHDARDRFGDDQVIVGVNTRDFATMATSLDRLVAMRAHHQAAVTYVAESGIRTPDDARLAAGAGYRLALVGSALMQAEDPARLLQQLIGAGRRA